jgi:polyisoprenoid-binding protein YceI
MRPLIKAILIGLLAFFVTANDAFSQQYLTQNGNVTFISTAPMLEFEGKSSNLVGLINTSVDSLDFYIDLNTLDTGIELRNRHMRESYLETEKFPFAEFTGTFSPSLKMEVSSTQNVTATGTFKIHGVAKTMLVQGTLTPMSQNQIKLTAEWTVNLSDFNISIPRVVFYELSEVQTVRIEAILTRRPQ